MLVRIADARIILNICQYRLSSIHVLVQCRPEFQIQLTIDYWLRIICPHIHLFNWCLRLNNQMRQVVGKMEH